MFDDNGNNQRPDFLQFLFLCASAPTFQLQESALKMQLEPDVEDNWRHLENALAMVRKLAEKQVPSFVPLVLQMLTGLNDDEEWCVSYEIDDGPAGQRRGAGQREPAELRKPHSRTRGKGVGLQNVDLLHPKEWFCKPGRKGGPCNDAHGKVLLPRQSPYNRERISGRKSQLLHSLGKCIETLGATCLAKEAMDEVLEVIDKFMNQHFQKDEKRTLTLKENYGEYHLSQRIL
ncbi:importin beta-3 [Culex quinquefasciatus]|uniref:Importin beta-3 n=1 Tax=Culex quinquefasciatus TaxID=7176 RepID=B0W720_CULQU|nr:importin beta-3 [Culex quinquefasciatus]|eukprot:XP_001844504.1 importin beta-3 [Culex quinquefasciatus]